MAKYTIWHNPRCSKSREALKLLEEKQVDIEVVEYLKDPPSSDAIKNICTLLGETPEKMMRTKEDLYRELGLNRATNSPEELFDIMSDNPSLIERPIIVKDNSQAVVGRPPEKVLELF